MDSAGVTNKSLQEEEIEAMSSIFESDWLVEDPLKNNSFNIKISNSSGDSVFFKVTLPEDYPLNSPLQYLISAPWMSREAKDRLTAMLEDIRGNVGSCVLYQCIVKIQDFINEDFTIDMTCDNSKDLVGYENTDFSSVPLSDTYDWSKAKDKIKSQSKVLSDNLCLPSKEEELLPIIHGEIIEDKKSIFQGHVAKAVSVDQVKEFLSKLKENRKIASANHNILAYRVRLGPNSFIQDFDDDGEYRAGGTLLQLLEKLDVKDVVVVVTRWYGGIHLGPDRFKDIKNAARKALLAGGFIQEKVRTT